MYRAEKPLFRQLATACPRTNVRIEHPELGGFDILWKNNLGKLRLQQFVSVNGVPFLSENSSPKLFEENGQLVEQPDYTLLHLHDQKGRVWIVEALSPITTEQEICFNLIQNGNAIRFIYGFSTETGNQEIQRVSLEIDAQESNRFFRDNFVARYKYGNDIRQLVSTKLRLAQKIDQQIVKAGDQRQRSSQFQHLIDIDEEKAIQLIIANDLKIIADGSINEMEQFYEYVELLSCVTETTRLAIKFPLDISHSQLLSVTSAKEASGNHSLNYQHGSIEVEYPSGEIIRFHPELGIGDTFAQPFQRTNSDIDDFIVWCKVELFQLTTLSDQIFTFSTDQQR